MESDLQNTGIGGLLLETTMQLAREAGYRTIIFIFPNQKIIILLKFNLG
ncbi:hypothetical protein [Clostridium sp. UBA4395]